jgi:thermolysin
VIRVALAAGVAMATVIGLQQPEVAAQANVAAGPDALRIAAATSAEVAQWNAVVNRELAAGTLQSRDVYAAPDDGARVVEALVQRHQGIEVYGGDVSRVRDGGGVVAVSGRFYTNIDVDTSPALTAAQAARRLEESTGSTIVPGRAPALMIVPTLDGTFALAYRLTTRDAKTYFVDADTGERLMEEDERTSQAAVGSGIGVLGDRKKVSATRRSGAFLAWDELRPGRILTLDTRGRQQDFDRLTDGGRVLESDVASDADNEWTQAAAVDVHTHTAWTYDYLFKRHGWAGVDGRNGDVLSVVNSGALLSNNAFFMAPPFGPNGVGGFFYGATGRGTPLTSLDIVAHEVMHGVTSAALTRRTGSGLGWNFPLTLGPSGCFFPFWCSGTRFILASNHAGAMNEALSDVFGSAVEWETHQPGSGTLRADYTVGEDVLDLSFERSLSDPAAYTIYPGVGYPDHVSNQVAFPVIFVGNGPFRCSGFACDVYPWAFVGGRLVASSPYASGAGLDRTDQGGVHMNLTVISHAYYLAVEGGRNRTSGRTVQGVGRANREQIERVFFVAVRDLLPRAAAFSELATALRQSARALYGNGSAAARAIDEALLAVGL